jgi:hypothetical protein
MFASWERPILAPVESSIAFLDAYQVSRGCTFSVEEREVAWAASLWPALYNAREQLLYQGPPAALRAIERQMDKRLSLANA